MDEYILQLEALLIHNLQLYEKNERILVWKEAQRNSQVSYFT